MPRPIAPEDLTWLLMDRPNNLMHVHAFMVFDEVPDLLALTEVIMERAVRKFRRLSQVPIVVDGEWLWEDDPDFDISHHVKHVVLDDIEEETFRTYLSGLFSVPFDRRRPLWEAQLVTGPPGGSKGYVLARFHHGLADGIRLVQLLISLCDPAEGAAPGAVGRNTDREHQHPLEQVLAVVGGSVGDTVDFAAGVSQAVGRAGKTLVTTTNPLRLFGHVGDALALVRHPVRLIDAVTGVASPDNDLSNSWREIGRMLLSDGSRAEAWSGRSGVEKSVAWVESLPLKGIRRASKAYDCTLNDVLLGAVSLALTDYLAERHVTDIRSLSWLMPVSMQPLDSKLPPTLGNKFVVVMMPMPLGITDPAELLADIHLKTTRVKNSAEPLAAFGVQRVIAESPLRLARGLTDFFAGKAIGQLSNVPGPRVPMTLAGAPVRSILGWVPTSGDQPLGICLFSYDGKISIGVATDARMIPDPLHLARLIEGHLEQLAQTPKDADV